MSNYTNLFQQFIAHTNEKETLKNELSILLKNHKFDSLLDIGCGTGAIIEQIIPNFKKISLLDIEDRLKDDIKNNPKVEFIQKDFLQFETDKKFDVILAAYVLWEIPYKEWDAFFENTQNLLQPNGIMVIIDEYSENKYDNPFFNFNTNIQPYNDYPGLSEFLSKKGFDYKIKKFKSQIFAKDELEMYEVLKFFFQLPKQRDFYQKSKQQIINNLKTKCNNTGCIINMQHIIYKIKLQ